MDTGSTAWMLTASALVLVMTPGLALFYGGMVRAKNVLGMLLKNFIAMGVVTITWVVIGYTLAFGPDAGAGLVGKLDFFGLRDVSNVVPEEGKGLIHGVAVPDSVIMVFQMMFAIITPALISGAIAERMKFTAWVVFIAIWSVVVYAPMAHWVWQVPDGFIGADIKAVDFAGGTVVHINAGAAALAMVLILGPRIGFRREVIRPHALPFTLLGAGLLWFGWFGFNGGSALQTDALAANAFIATQIAAGVAGTAWALMEYLRHGKATTLGFASGAVAGLVAITPASGFVGPVAAIVIGIAAGVLCFLALQIKFRFNFDDALDVVAVHLVGGIIGSLMVGLFADRELNPLPPADGLFFGGGFEQLGRQALAVVIAAAYSFVVTYILGMILNATMGLRVSEQDERRGLDLALHEEQSYVLAE